MSNGGIVSEQLRILIADDHALFRRGLCEVLEEDGSIRVVAEADDGEEAVRLAIELGTEGLDLVLMDLAMPKLNGIGATRQILAEAPGLRIVILTASIHDTDLFVAIDNGVTGFLNKNMHPDALVRTVADFGRSGGLAMTRATAAKALGYLQQQRASEPLPQPPTLPASPSGEAAPPVSPVAHLLTVRELDVLELMAKGLQNQEIAGRLMLSENTVPVHVRHILRKLNVRNRMEAVARYRGDAS